MTVKGKIVDKKKLYMRMHLLEGKLGDTVFNVSINVDGKAIFVEALERKVMYHMADIVKDAIGILQSIRKK